MCQLITIEDNLKIADIKEGAIKNIINSAPICSDINQIILFGSSIREDCTKKSDIDIAVFGRKSKSKMFKTKSYKDFLSNLYKYDDFGENYDILYFKFDYDDDTEIMKQIKKGVKIYNGA